MFKFKTFNRNEKGQAALETAILLIAFVVVASVFAFAILSAGSSSTEKGQQAIYAGLEGVQSSMEPKGAIVANGTVGTKVDDILVTVSVTASGNAVDLTDPSASKNVVVINYRDNTQTKSDLSWTVAWIGKNDGDNLLEAGELAEIKVSLSGLTTPLAASTNFTLEVKPPTGAVLNINRTTPAKIEKVMELR
ncbi:MAG: archaellin/type IV pilin N-terminal domain-containing protein [Anaerolineae bacterium]|nr:hypothetical protein [Anaerolineae bacterium]